MSTAGVHFVTGKLGSGKTLTAVGKIRDKLRAGCPVATNLDLRLDKLIGQMPKKTVVYRLPDKPTAADMQQLGQGNSSYDDTKNGLIVLDECGTWFNARSWQDKDRAGLIDWLLHARKLGWDIIFIIQDISMVDKQARKSVAEHVVYCRRMDKLSIPFLDSFVSFITSGTKIPKPKMHLGIVKYGDQPTSITVDRWLYQGKDLYPAYDTKQMFLDDYPHGLYQVLPPYFSHGRYRSPRNWSFYMRMTKIMFRRFSRVFMLSAGIASGAAMAAYMGAGQPEPVIKEVVVEPESVDEKVAPAATAEGEKLETLADKFRGHIIQGVAQDADGKPIFMEVSGPDGSRYNLQSLRASGLVVKMVSECELLLTTVDRSEHVRLYTSYCKPEGPDVPPMMSDADAKAWQWEQRKIDYQASR